MGLLECFGAALFICLIMLGFTLKGTGYYEDRKLYLLKDVPAYHVNRRRTLERFLNKEESDSLLTLTDCEIKEYLKLKSENDSDDLRQYNIFLKYTENMADNHKWYDDYKKQGIKALGGKNT